MGPGVYVDDQKMPGGGFIKLLVLLYAASCRLQVLWNFEFYRDCFAFDAVLLYTPVRERKRGYGVTVTGGGGW